MSRDLSFAEVCDVLCHQNWDTLTAIFPVKYGPSVLFSITWNGWLTLGVTEITRDGFDIAFGMSFHREPLYQLDETYQVRDLHSEIAHSNSNVIRPERSLELFTAKEIVHDRENSDDPPKWSDCIACRIRSPQHDARSVLVTVSQDFPYSIYFYIGSQQVPLGEVISLGQWPRLGVNRTNIRGPI